MDGRQRSSKVFGLEAAWLRTKLFVLRIVRQQGLLFGAPTAL